MNTSQKLVRFSVMVLMCLVAAASYAIEYHFVPGGANDWWVTTTNWDPVGAPNSINDVAVFDASTGAAYSTNVHNLYYVIREMRFDTTSTWSIHNGRQDPTLQAPIGANALITQNGSGAVTFTTDLVFNSDTVFGGSGTGSITVNGSSNSDYKETLRGAGGLTMNGDYTLTLNLPVSYQGPTTINGGTVLFNGDTVAPVYSGNTVVGYTPVTLQTVTVNAGATIGGTGSLRAPVVVNSGGNFAPGAGAAGIFTIDNDLALTAGANTLIELGGLTAGNGSGHHDQAIVTGQLSLGGTLQVSLGTGHTPILGSSYTIMQYGSLNPAAAQFDAISYSVASWPSHYGFVADYGTGTNSAVTLSAAATYYYTGNHSTYDYWEYADNWDPQEKPGSVASRGDIVIFDASKSSRNRTNIWNNDRYVRDVQFNTTGTWELYHNHYTLHLNHPTSGIPSRFTQNNSGAITINCDTRLDTDAVFGGSGTGTVTVKGRLVEKDATRGLRQGLFGPGGLTKEGNYTLILENYASYQGATVINEGTLLFNAESARPNPNFDSGDTSTWTWVPVTMAEVTVNSGATLGGTGILRAPVTVNSGGSFAPGVSPGVFTIDNDLTLAAGSNTLIELGGLTAGTGSGHHDQAIVTGQLSLSGTLAISLHGGYVPTVGDSYTIFQYGTLDASENAFDTVVSPAISGRPANYRFAPDYGSGTNDDVTITLTAMPHYYTRGHATDDWWYHPINWSHGIVPGSNPNEGDVVIFALTDLASYSVNTHAGNPYTVKEIRFEGTSNWRLYNPHRDIGLRHPEAGESALFTHDGSGTVTLDCDLVMDDDTIFSGTGSGTVTINGSPLHSSLGPGEGVIGSGGLTKNGDYTLVINSVASYAGETIINAGTLLFNGESAARNSAWVEGEPDTYYNPATMAAVAVNGGGTLAGTGILRAPVTVHTGGLLSPGASAGIFTVDSLALDAGSTTLMELAGTTAGNGSGYHDQVLVNGLLSLGGTLEIALLEGFEPEVGDSFVLFEYGSLDPTHNAFDTLSIPFAGEFSINYGSGTNSQIILRVVPEPAALVLLLLGLATLLLRRNRI